MRTRRVVALGLALVMGSVASAIAGQEDRDGYGVSDDNAVVVGWASFFPADGTRTYLSDRDTGLRWIQPNQGVLIARIPEIPEGARIHGPIWYVHNSVGQDYDMTLWVCRTWRDRFDGTDRGGDCPDWVAVPTTGDVRKSGGLNEVYHSQEDVDGDGDPEVVDWFLMVHSEYLSDTNLSGIGAVEVLYQRQVSPAPATATFDDVPTGHPFFQYVEALSAAGITAGCGGGDYCPDAAVTRGQVAVLLAKALGLHWPVN